MYKILLIIFSFFLTISCSGDIEELKLIKYSDKNKSYEFEIVENEFDEKDSLLSQKKYLKVFDVKNRLINQNNSSFYFYDNENKISEIKSIYRRGAKTSIINNKYIYDENGNLKFKMHNNDTVRYFLYNKHNQLIEEGNKLTSSKTTYRLLDKRISEKTEYENDIISKISKFTYDLNGNKIIDDWIFNSNQKMKTYYKYNSKNKLVSERDSCITTFGNANEYVEFLTEYFYDKNDSLVEKRNLGRVLSEKDFKLRGKTKFEYKKL